MGTPYGQGYEAGRRNADTRSCPYDSTEYINEWLNGYFNAQGEQ